MRLEAEYAPKVPDEPDLTRYARFFSTDEVNDLIARILARVAADKPTHLSPATAYLVVRALNVWAAEPRRETIVREICGVSGGCEKQCVGCTGKANAVMALYAGRPAR